MINAKVLFFGLAALSQAAPTRKGYLEVPLTVNEIKGGLARRQVMGGPVENLKNFYYGAQLEIGTPPQKIDVILDTCSSDLFVFSPESGHPMNFNRSASQSIELVPNQAAFSSSFQPEDITATGAYYKDKVSFYGASVTQEFAIVGNDIPHVFDHVGGLFGIGGTQLEGTHPKYPNFPAQLVAEGVIDYNGYSIQLNSRNASTGSIIFGGADVEKYSGNLNWLRNLKPRNTFFGVAVTVDGITETAMLDTGTQFVYLNSQIVDSIAQKLSATYDPQRGLIVPNPPEKPEPFVFQFGKGVITVPYEEFLADPADPHVVALFKTSESGGIPLLGSSFLRSAYVVYDFHRNQAAIAQARYTDKSRIVPLTQGLPNAIAPARGGLFGGFR